jgi:hypothetical protein
MRISIWLLAALLFALIAAPAQAQGSPNPFEPKPVCWLSVERPQGLDSRIRLPDDPVQVYRDALPDMATGINAEHGATVITDTNGVLPWMLFSAHKTPSAKISAPFQNLHLVPVGTRIWVSLCDGTVLEYRVTASFVEPTLQAWATVWRHRFQDTIALYGCEGCGLWKPNKKSDQQINDCEARVPRGWYLDDRTHKRVLFAERVR